MISPTKLGTKLGLKSLLSLLTLATLTTPLLAQEDSPLPSTLSVSLPSSASTAPPKSTTTTSKASTKTSTALTTVVSIFYIDIRGDEEHGLPYTQLHRNAGSILAVDPSATTYIITGTRTPTPNSYSITASDPATESTSLPPSLASATLKDTLLADRNKTGHPSTITQGPSTFLFTGSNYGPERTLVNRCRLEGLTWATCDLTHIGKGWYTRRSPDFAGEWSTYNYTWTSGDRFGFAPVTITEGVDKLPGPSAQTTDSQEGAAGGSRSVLLREAYGMVWVAVVLGGFVVGIFAML